MESNTQILTGAMIAQNTVLKNFFEITKGFPELIRTASTWSEINDAIGLLERSINKAQEGLDLTKSLVMPEGQPIFAPDYSNRRGYSTPSYDGNIDAENNPSLHRNS